MLWVFDTGVARYSAANNDLAIGCVIAAVLVRAYRTMCFSFWILFFMGNAVCAPLQCHTLMDECGWVSRKEARLNMTEGRGRRFVVRTSVAFEWGKGQRGE